MKSDQDRTPGRIFEIRDVTVRLPFHKEALGDLVFAEDAVYFIPLQEYDVGVDWKIAFLGGAAYPYFRAVRLRKEREWASGEAERTRAALVGERLESLAAKRPNAIRIGRAGIRQISYSWLLGFSITGGGLRFFRLPEGRKTYKKFEDRLSDYLRNR